MNDKCSICLNDFNGIKDKIKKEFSCGHALHFCCFRDLIYYKNNNYFVCCPLCRRKNTNVDNIYENPIDNIKILCSNKINTMHCLHKINGKRRCKRKPHILNYGYCYQHNKDILPKEKYDLMIKFMNLILYQRNNLLKKIQSFDIGKKIIIHKCNNNSTIDNVMYYFYQWLSLNDIYQIKDYTEMYQFYNLKKPPIEWIQYCIENKTLL
mgnify:CR=1 FL=1